MRFFTQKIVNTLTNLRELSNLAPFPFRFGALGVYSWPSLRDYSPLLFSAFPSWGHRVFVSLRSLCVLVLVLEVRRRDEPRGDMGLRPTGAERPPRG